MTTQGFELKLDTTKAKQEIEGLRKVYVSALKTMQAAGLKGRAAETAAVKEVGRQVKGGAGIERESDKQLRHPKGTPGGLGGRFAERGTTPLEELPKVGAVDLSLGQIAREARPPIEELDKSLIKLQASVNGVKKRGNEFQEMQKRMGHNSGVTSQQVTKLQIELDRLRGKIQGTSVAHDNLRRSIDGQNESLARLNSTVAVNSQKMTFMGGASVLAQKGIRLTGAAAQGSMLAFSAMKGDVLGLAFSLIFLQFAANIPVALGAAAIGIAAIFATKQIKKMIQEEKELKQIGNDFYEITGSAGALEIATEKSKVALAEFGLTKDDAKAATDALVQAQLQLLDRGLAPTNKALAASAYFWLIATSRGQDYEEALKSTTKATVSFAKDGVANIGDATLSFDALEQRASRALKNISRKNAFVGVSTEEVIAMYKKAGMEIPKEITSWDLSPEQHKQLMGDENAAIFWKALAKEREGIIKDITMLGDELFKGKVEAGLKSIEESYEILGSQDSIAMQTFKKMREELKETTKDMEKHSPQYFLQLDTLAKKYEKIAEQLNLVKQLNAGQLLSSLTIGALDVAKGRSTDWQPTAGDTAGGYRSTSSPLSPLHNPTASRGVPEMFNIGGGGGGRLMAKDTNSSIVYNFNFNGDINVEDGDDLVNQTLDKVTATTT